MHQWQLLALQDKHSDVLVRKSGWNTTSWMLLPGGYIVCDGSIVGWKRPGKAKVTQLQLSHSSIAYANCTDSCKINSLWQSCRVSLSWSKRSTRSKACIWTARSVSVEDFAWVIGNTHCRSVSLWYSPPRTLVWGLMCMQRALMWTHCSFVKDATHVLQYNLHGGLVTSVINVNIGMLTRMNWGVDEQVLRLDVSVYNVIVMTPSNSFHQLVHVVLDLRPSVLHVSQCLEAFNNSVSGRETTRKVRGGWCTCIGVKQLWESSKTSRRFFSMYSNTRYCMKPRVCKGKYGRHL